MIQLKIKWSRINQFSNISEISKAIIQILQKKSFLMSTGKKYNRVWVDGCFDVTHFGHYNFIRQASLIGDYVVAGVHDDEDIARNKSPPVFTLQERVEMVGACKWVNEVVPGSPFTMTDLSWLDRYNCEVALHGDDITLDASGKDCYSFMRDAGRFDTLPRTKSISTTNLIGRMLRLPALEMPENVAPRSLLSTATSISELQTYLPTCRRIAQFTSISEPKPDDRIIYVDGTFDLLHPGHISFLRKAKALGDYMIVGVHSDEDVASHSMPGMPIMTLQERVLNVLAIKYVDDVVIGAPYIITKDLLKQINPTLVVSGQAATSILRSELDSFRVPKEMGIYKTVESDYPDMTVTSVVHRIMKNYALYAERNSKREKLACEQTNFVHSEATVPK